LLFLTTNRPGALDEAFKSRIHLKLYYPALSKYQTQDIWDMNLKRLRIMEEQRCFGTDEVPLHICADEIMEFAKRQFYSNDGKTRWNGRQIRNAFQIASSLAYYDARKEQHDVTLDQQQQQHHGDGSEADVPTAVPSLPIHAPLRVQPRLDVKHFEMIRHITDDFDQYMQETIGKTDAEMAYERDDRADHWVQQPERSNTQDSAPYFSYPPASPNSTLRPNPQSWTSTQRQPGAFLSGWDQSNPSMSLEGQGFGEGGNRGVAPFAPPSPRPGAGPGGRPTIAPSFSFSNGGDRDFGPSSGGSVHGSISAQGAGGLMGRSYDEDSVDRGGWGKGQW